MLLLLTVVSGGEAPADADNAFVRVTVCELLRSPESHAGQLVSIQVSISDARSVRLADPNDRSCGEIPWALADDRRVKPRPHFNLLRDRNYEELLGGLGVLVPKPPRSRGFVNATLEGRFDSIYRLKNRRRKKVAEGFGHLRLDDARFVLHRVIDVSVKTGLLPEEKAHATLVQGRFVGSLQKEPR